MRFSWSRSLASCILFHAGFQTVIPLVIAGSPTAHPLAAAAGPTTLLSKAITHPMRPSGYLGLDPSCGSPGAGPNVNNPACNPNTISPINGSPTVTGSAAPKPSACPDADTPPEFNDDDDDDDDDDDGASPVPNQGEGPSAPSAKRDAPKPFHSGRISAASTYARKVTLTPVRVIQTATATQMTIAMSSLLVSTSEKRTSRKRWSYVMVTE
jgi:hypothetical protein